MKKYILFIGVTGFINLQGCTNEKKTNTESVETPVEQAPLSTGTVNTDSGQTTIAAPAVQPAAPAGEVSAPAAASASSGPNPAHGEPGHRCDIAVGAPLNSPPGKNAPAAPSTITVDPNKPAAAAQPVQVQPSTPSVVKTPTPPGMNPPHGEPGHDCSIAVGAPLKK